MKRIYACTLTILISLMNPTPLLNLLTLGYTDLENESERVFLLSICDRLWENRTLAGKMKITFKYPKSTLNYFKMNYSLLSPNFLKKVISTSGVK